MATASVNLAACDERRRAAHALTWDDQFTGNVAPTQGRTSPALAYDTADGCKAAGEVPAPTATAPGSRRRPTTPPTRPRYGDKAACEAEYGEGRCETRPQRRGSFFIPSSPA